MRVTVLFFGVLKEIAGSAEECLELPSGATLELVFEHFAQRHPRLAAMRPSILLARNRQFARGATPVSEGDEIALLPPVSGGSGAGGHHVSITRDSIDVAELKRRVQGDEDGAVVIFEGVVRNNSNGRRTLWLEYECYEPMALQVMAELGRSLATTAGVSRIGIVHRLGRLEIGETSVAIAVSAPHRKPAFEVCLEAINRLKRTVPIWKKEHFEDGEVWVEGDWDSSLIRS